MRLVLSLLFLVSCVSPQVYLPGPLLEQILVPREGYTGLTNGYCAEFSGSECKNFVVKSYDLSNKETRDILRELEFICKLGDKRFQICADQKGFCHRYYKRSFLSKKEIVEYIDQGETQRLLSGGFVCFSENQYPYLEI